MLGVLLLTLGLVALWYGFAASFVQLLIHSWLPGPGGALFWLKWALLRLPAAWCRRRGRFQFYSYEAYDPYSYGVLPPPEETALDGVQESSEDATRGVWSDDLLLWGSNDKGDVMVARIRRCGKGRSAQSWLYLRAADGQSYVLPSTSSGPDLSAGTVYSAGGLRLEQLVPMRRWRVAYNGLLRCTSIGDELVHVQLGMICNTTSNVLEHSADFDANFVARQLARQNWTDVGVPSINRLLDEVDCYMQTVYCTGSLQVEGQEQRELFLWGLRIKRRENLLFPVQTLGEMMGRTKSGLLFYLREVRIHGLTESYQLGMVGLPSTEVDCLRDVTPSVMGSGATFNKDFKLSFGPPSDKFRFRVQVDSEVLDVQPLPSEQFGKAGEVKLELRPFLMNDHGGCLIYLSATCGSLKPAIYTFSAASQLKPCNIILRCFFSIHWHQEQSWNELRCFLPSLSVGIRSTAARYASQARDELRLKDRGAIIKRKRPLQGNGRRSTHSYLLHIIRSVNGYLGMAINISVICSRQSQRAGSDVASSGYSNHSVCSVGGSKEKRVSSKLNYSARSTAELDPRGRPGDVNEVTSRCCHPMKMAFYCAYLPALFRVGIPLRCFARTYPPEAPERASAQKAFHPHHSPPVDDWLSPVASSFPSDKAGRARRFVKNREERIILLESGNTQRSSHTFRSSSCTHDRTALKPPSCCVCSFSQFFCRCTLPKMFTSNQLAQYVTLLQLHSRPVTSLHQQTDCEVLHELDSGFRSSDECLFKANIGEVMSGAQSPLGLAAFSNSMLLAAKKENNKLGRSLRTPYHDRFFIQTLGNIFFPASNEIFKMSGSNPLRKGLALAMRGGCLDDPDVDRLMQERQQLRCQVADHFELKRMVTNLWNAEKTVQAAYDEFFNWKVPVADMQDSRLIFQEITRSFMTTARLSRVHGACNMYSIMANSLLVTLLARQHGEWSDVMLSDFGNLMSTCEDVISADVPSALQKMAVEMSKSPEQAKFKDMNADDALEWLRKDTSGIGDLFSDFLKRHGHRCVNEFDVYSKTWGMDPRPLIKNLQAMIGTVGDYKKKNLSVDDAIKDLHVKLGPVKRHLLRMLLQKCRRGVALREHSKASGHSNLLVKATDAFRASFWHLAYRMEAEGRLPDAELLFFLTLSEIELLLTTRSPRLVSKAMRRHRLQPELKKRVFPELFKGIPQLLDPSARVEIAAGQKSVKGTPVSGGVAEGPARVVRSIEDACHIQKGDVLVAYCTDIAWSPFFPLLSGVVTELGGLISHGAVVAREYGIPCVVGVHGITGILCSGERVRLDGNTGVLHTVEAVE
ncbi:unnamed protein product [Ixodes hexagonus]